MTTPDPGLLDEAAETTTHTEPVEDVPCSYCGWTYERALQSEYVRTKAAACINFHRRDRPR